MKLSTLLSSLSLPAPRDHEIGKIVIDSRKADASSLFIAMKGIKADGHDYLSDAAARCAPAAIVSESYRGQDYGMTLIRVTDPRAALPVLCARLADDPQEKLRFVLVTGTNGKTSTCHMLHAIMTTCGIRAAVIGTLQGPLTTPDPTDLFPLLRDYVHASIEYVIMEASSHALALHKLDPITADYGIFTNLTPEHLDFHHSMEEYLNAKATLFRTCRVGIFNLDDAYASSIMKQARCEIVTYSQKNETADFLARNVVLSGTVGIRYDCLTQNRLFRVNTPIPGRFTVYNTLAALSCAYHIGITPHCIRTALAHLDPIPGRIERLPLPTRRLSVYLDFAHTPDALENILTTLRDFLPGSGKLTVVFGCGGERDKSKRPVMGQIASRLADQVIITSDNSRGENPIAIIDDILQGIPPEMPHTVIQSRAAAIEYAIMTASVGDIILLSGKGHESYEIDQSGKHPFSERALVKEAYHKRFGT